MFQDFLRDKVRICPMKRSLSNRTNKDQMANEEKPVLESVPCRIGEEKAIFLPDIHLVAGDVIENQISGEQYEVTGGKKTRSQETVHHRTYSIRKRNTAARNGGQ